MRLVPGTCSAVRAPSTRSCRWNGTVPGSFDTFDSTLYPEGNHPSTRRPWPQCMSPIRKWDLGSVPRVPKDSSVSPGLFPPLRRKGNPWFYTHRTWSPGDTNTQPYPRTSGVRMRGQRRRRCIVICTIGRPSEIGKRTSRYDT